MLRRLPETGWTPPGVPWAGFCGNGGLQPLEELLHCGGVVPRVAAERADRLLRRLRNEVSRRLDLLADGGYADVDEQRATAPPQQRLPYLLLVLDRWEGFATTFGELDGGRLIDDVMGLLREGASVGLHVLISGDRSLLLGRIGALVEHKLLLLRLPDRNDYALAGIAVRDVPEQLPPGRGVWADSAVETQIAVLSDDLTGTGQAAAVHAIAEAARLRDDSTASPLRPFRLADLPTHVPAEPLLDALQPVDVAAGVDRPEGPRPGDRHPGRTFPTRPRLWVPLGIGEDDSDLLGLDLSASPVAVIAGPPRSGRTAALRFVQAAAARREVRTLAVCPRGGALADQTRRVLGPAAVFTGTGSDPDQSEQALIGALRELPPQSLILVDDAEMVRDGDLAPALLAVARQAREKSWGVVVTGDTTHLATGLSGWLFEARRARQGLLLAPRNLADGEVVGVRLVPSQLVTRNLPGRGLLFGATEHPTAVQGPLVQEPDPGRG